MGCIFIVMPKEEDANRIAATLEHSLAPEGVFICKTGSEVLQRARDWSTGVVIATKKMRDMSYTEMCEYLPDYFGMVIITSDTDFEPISQRVAGLHLPFKRIELVETTKYLQRHLASQKKKSSGPKKRSTEEQQLIDQAKALLMEYDNMTEPEAFRYIQKNSMDGGRSMIESAQMIIFMKKN